jgi:pimeloyl-ACP methyl ester carboxylesterase
MPDALELYDRAAMGLAGRFGIRPRRVATPGGAVAFYDGDGRGDLPTLVLQHGLGAGNAAQFLPLAAVALRDFRRVVCVDLPGHGASPPLARMDPHGLYDSVAHALDAETTGPLVLVGNSLGGAVMLEYALQRPARAHALVLTSPAGAPCSDEERDETLRVFAMRSTRDARAFFARMHRRPPVWSRWMAPGVVARFRAPHVQELVASFRDGLSFSPARLASHRVPTLLAWGVDDRLLPASMLAWWKAHLPAAVEEPPWGHCPHLDDPVGFYRWVRAFARAPR